nr:MAG TPA: Transcription factor WhiB [Caudoviricetes sp.]
MHSPQSPSPTTRITPATPRGKSVKSVWREKAPCQHQDPRLWDLDSAAWRGHPLEGKPRGVRAAAICNGCPMIRECAKFALDIKPRMIGVVLAGVDIPVQGGAKAREAKKQLREIAYGETT